MKNLYLKRVLLFFIILLVTRTNVFSQVPIPDTTTTGWYGLTTLKWDNRNYLITTGNNANYVTAAMAASQAFSMGSNRVVIARAGLITSAGQNNTFTGYSNSYGVASAVLGPGGTTLNSVAFTTTGAATLTFTFDTLVSHVAFSLYDMDQSQQATVTAKDDLGVSDYVYMGNAAASGALNTITGSGTTSAKSTSTGSSAGLTSNTATVNVYILGFTPAGTRGVKTVTISFANSGDFFLSDIWASVYSGFGNVNYYNVSKPWTNQPAYVLANSDGSTGSVLATTAGVGPTIGGVALTTGNARYFMKDSSTFLHNIYLNSFAYDPYNHFMYYTYDGTPVGATIKPSINRAIKRYSFNTIGAPNATMLSGTSSVVIPDISLAPYNIPSFDVGLESGAAAFSHGSLYIGIEGSNDDSTIGGKHNVSNRYSMIWRIDFNTGDSVPYQACQVFGGLADNGAQTLYHDWGDITISNDTLYDFNEANQGTYSGWIHYNLQTGLIGKSFLNAAKPLAGQAGILWNNQVYRFASAADSLSPYNYNGTIGTDTHIAGFSATKDWEPGGAGDASDAFKPPLDYGDAPASFDPVEPASHDYDSTIRFGTFWNPEFAKKATVDASGDGVTDDGMPALPVFTHAQNYYDAYVKVYNHSGLNTTVAGWIDFNNDGVFQTGEGTTATVASNTALQTIHLAWGPVSTIPLAANYVFMRIRITSATNALSASTPTGYFSNGEVEDYKITIDDILPVRLLSFKATAVNNAVVNLQWNMASEMNMKEYIVERSNDEINWKPVLSEKPDNNPEGTRSYEDNDNNPLTGRSYYRLKMIDYTGAVTYSEIDKVDLDNAQFSVARIIPNPFHSTLTINATLPESGNIIVNVIDATGKSVRTYQQSGNTGGNTIVIDNLGALIPGVYVVEVTGNGISIKQKLVKE